MLSSCRRVGAKRRFGALASRQRYRAAVGSGAARSGARARRLHVDAVEIRGGHVHGAVERRGEDRGGGRGGALAEAREAVAGVDAVREDLELGAAQGAPGERSLGDVVDGLLRALAVGVGGEGRRDVRGRLRGRAGEEQQQRRRDDGRRGAGAPASRGRAAVGLKPPESRLACASSGRRAAPERNTSARGGARERTLRRCRRGVYSVRGVRAVAGAAHPTQGITILIDVGRRRQQRETRHLPRDTRRLSAGSAERRQLLPPPLRAPPPLPPLDACCSPGRHVMCVARIVRRGPAPASPPGDRPGRVRSRARLQRRVCALARGCRQPCHGVFGTADHAKLDPAPSGLRARGRVNTHAPAR